MRVSTEFSCLGSMDQFLNLISLSEEGQDRGQEGRSRRQGAGVRGEVKRRWERLILVRYQLEEAEGRRKGMRRVGEGEVAAWPPWPSGCTPWQG